MRHKKNNIQKVRIMRLLKKANGVLCLFVFSTAFIACDTNNGQISSRDISLPPGFKIDVYANVPNARSMALSEEGILFVRQEVREMFMPYLIQTVIIKPMQ